jgi:TolB-like protein
LSGDPAHDYLADGLTDNLLDALAQNPGLFVIARNATQVYRGKAVAPRAVAKDLGIRYVLEGSVQKSGDRIRVTAQLIDAVNDNHMLSQKYDRNLTDLFALEDDLTLQIAGALDVQLRRHIGSRLRSWHAQPRSLGEPRKSNPSLLSLQPRRRERGAEARTTGGRSRPELRGGVAVPGLHVF